MSVVEKLVGAGEADGVGDGNPADAAEATGFSGPNSVGFEPGQTLCVGVGINVAIDRVTRRKVSGVETWTARREVVMFECLSSVKF